jgi:hypothetical protein
MLVPGSHPKVLVAEQLSNRVDSSSGHLACTHHQRCLALVGPPFGFRGLPFGQPPSFAHAVNWSWLYLAALALPPRLPASATVIALRFRATGSVRIPRDADQRSELMSITIPK